MTYIRTDDIIITSILLDARRFSEEEDGSLFLPHNVNEFAG